MTKSLSQKANKSIINMIKIPQKTNIFSLKPPKWKLNPQTPCYLPLKLL